MIFQFLMLYRLIIVKIVRNFQLGFWVVFNYSVKPRKIWRVINMYGCKCFYWSKISNSSEPEPEYFSLPDPIPQWPQGSGFSNGIINLGELEVCQVSRFEFIWGRDISTDGKQGASFYKPIGIPNGFFSLGHHCHSNKKPFREFVLAARIATNTKTQSTSIHSSSPLSNPVDYSLVWSSDDGGNESFDKNGYFWLPQSPERYKALGFLVTNKPEKPNLDEVKCVRSDLTDTCKTYRVILKTNSNFLKVPLLVWNTRPLHRGIFGRGVSSGTFLASSDCSLEDELNIACLKNLDNSLHAMPNVDQIHALIRHYGPTVFFHPDEVYLPSSVSWFFRNGAMLYNNNESESSEENIATDGSNLPNGETNDGKYWIDLPMDRQREEYVKHGNIESAKLYVHIKPALGGTFTDIVMWVFCPFNGPANLKVGMVNIALSKIGQHVGDWEHFTLRISNFTGELCSIYFSQHSGGVWIDIFDLEFIEGNKAIVYSSKHGHASFPHPGNHIQGSSKLGIGIRNDAARSDYYIDSSEKYEIIAAEYLGHGVVDEPCWLQYMREWGPTVLYDSRTDIEKVIRVLPVMLQFSVDNIFNKLPVELCKEEGPTGPKEKNNWFGDERW